MKRCSLLLFTSAVAFFIGRATKRGQGTLSSLIMSRVEHLDTHITIEGDIRMIELKEGQRVRVTVTPKSAHDSVATVQTGSVNWLSSDESVASVEQDSTNELSAIITRKGTGEALVTVKADADLGEGIREITGVGSVVCLAPEAKVFAFEFGEPEDVPADASATSGE